MSIIWTVFAVITGVVLVVIGVFSLAALLWDDLLESSPHSARHDRLSNRD